MQETITTTPQVTEETSSTAVNIRALIIGVFFGIVLVKGEVVSWYQIQAMFRFESFHMYGIIGSAVVVGAISLFILKRLNMHSIDGDDLVIKKKKLDKGTIIGGIIFGLGWAITGACPAPIYAQVGSGTWLAIVTLLSAWGGAYLYGALRPKLPV
ncbi:MAG: DUF6691 family protein [Candidatus Promineifilaceae bacterium]|jgi:uncharacterized membrane protein YedE/YeeE